MMEYFLVYNGETGEVLSRGQGPAGTAAIQQLEQGMAVMVVPRQAVQTLGSVNLDAIRTSFAASIDMDADKVRGMFITNTPGQLATYLEKEAEARRVLADATAPTVFLALEAEALGKDVVDLAQEVVAQADMWRPIGARIEAARRKAKTALAAAPHLASIADAILIDWLAVVEPAAPPLG